MRDLEALRLALYVFHLPSAVRGVREKPLPAGILSLLEVAAGEAGAAEAAASKLDRPPEVVSRASSFFIEQILLAPDADAYRVLGAGRDIGDADLRRNMALILRWVHPDTNRTAERSAYAARVTKSWEALKSHDRRAAYDAANPVKVTANSSRISRRRSNNPRGPAQQAQQTPHGFAERSKPGLIEAALRFILGARGR